MLNYLKKSFALFTFGMLLILLAVFLKTLDVNDVFKTLLFIAGLIIEGVAISIYIKNKIF